jgi:ketosteroid isomerase-like protein
MALARTKGATTMTDEAAKVATAYFDAWKVNDFDTVESLVADHVTFVGPLAQLEGTEDYMEGIKGFCRRSRQILFSRRSLSTAPMC